MRSLLKKWLILGLLGILALLLSGCFMQLMLGRVFVRTIGEEVEGIIAATFSNTTTAVCTEEEFENENGQIVTDVECTYVIASEEFPFIPEQTSTAELISEFGILGVIIDPLILQVPADATNFVGTFGNGSGPELIVITAVTSFKADVTTEVLPESGQKFVILEFPSVPADGTNFNFSLEFELPSLADVDVKPMFAGKVEMNGDTFYPPMLPCTNDFSSIPAVTIPVSDSFDDLSFQIINALDTIAPCDGQVYNYISAQPANELPDCSDAAPSAATIWPPDHRFVPIGITGVTDPDGDDISITIDGIWQDEPVDTTGDGSFAPAGRGVGTDTAHLRAERTGGSGKNQGNGRVYYVFFTADDGNGGLCSDEALVGVPHD
jgi:hypothetical protein